MIRSKVKVLAFVFPLFVFCAVPAKAWNALGHWTVAEIAWRQMDSSERRAASDLLKHHPHYDLMLAVDVPAGVDTNEWAFLNAAVWLDRVRPARPGDPPKPKSITKYNVHPHGVELPFLLGSDTNRYLLRNFVAPKTSAETALRDAVRTLKKRSASPHDRAVSLCVALHLFGDLHQPLHAATLLTKEHPRGNAAGGTSIVRDPRGNTMPLHVFWDQLPGNEISYSGVVRLANELAASAELRPAALPEYRAHKKISSWAQESFRSAVDFAYAENRVQFVHVSAVNSGKVPPSEVPLMSAEYMREAREIARRRLALAAHRLSDELKKIW